MGLYVNVIMAPSIKVVPIFLIGRERCTGQGNEQGQYSPAVRHDKSRV